MLSQQDKDELKKYGIDHDKLEAAIKDATEVAVGIQIKAPDGSQFISDADLATRDGVKITEGKKLAAPAEFEIAKRRLEKSGIELKGTKWDEVADELKTAIGKDKDAAFAALQEQNRLLIADKDTLTIKATQAEQALQTGMFDLEIMTQLPAHGAGLTPAETLQLAKSRGYSFEKTDTGVIVKKAGVALTDGATHATLPLDKAIATIWTEQKWTAAAPAGGSGGRGGGDGDPAGKSGLGSRSSATAKWKELNPNKNEMSTECSNYIAEAAKDNTAFVWD